MKTKLPIFPAVTVVFTVSGMAGLVYEVLWLKDISRLLGSTSLGASVTLAVFFLGLAVGGYVFGRVAPRFQRPLLLYAALEIGIALSAVWYLWLLGYALTSLPPATGSLAYKTAAAFVLLFPAAFCMGGTFPAVAQAVLRTTAQKQYGTALLYNCNILGAVVGAFLAGFVLPPWLGYKVSYIVIIAINLLLAAGAWYVSRITPKTSEIPTPMISHVFGGLPTRPAAVLADQRWIAALLFLSGFGTLALQVAWTRMFSQVMQNDVYSFAAVVVSFLLCLMAGAVAAQWLQRKTYPMATVVTVLLGTGGLLVLLSPFIFSFMTRGLSGAPGGAHWVGIVAGIFMMAAASIAVPVAVLGTVFPYILSVIKTAPAVAPALGRMLAINTTGSIIGPLLTGFVLLPMLGLYRTIAILGCLYVATAAVLLFAVQGMRRAVRIAAPLVLVALVAVWFTPKLLDEVRLNPAFREQLLSLVQGTGGSVAVVRGYGPHDDPKGPGDTYIRLNNTYTLGGVGALASQQRQAHLGMWLHPRPENVFFLGLATGTTAGASLHYPVKKVTVCELLPEVVTAARQHFAGYSNGLYTDKRVTILAEDGRTCLASGTSKYDVIISDLFNPVHAGTGSLYTRETFATARGQLEADGVFVQWLPLYQLGEEDFGTIARTMLEVFPQVTLWRGNFATEQPIVALVGQQKDAQLDPLTFTNGLEVLGASAMAEPAADAVLSVKPGDRYAKRTQAEKAYIQGIWPQLSQAGPFTFYAGNLTAQKHAFAAYPLNTDERPVIEFNAPKNQTKLGSMTGLNLQNYLQKHFPQKGYADDPYLSKLNPDQKRYVEAGAAYYAYFALQQDAFVNRNPQSAAKAAASFKDYLQKIGIQPQ